MITPVTDELIDLALGEDLAFGDLTSRAVFSEEQRSTGAIEARQNLVVCGLEVAARIFARVDPAIRVVPLRCDGDYVRAGVKVMRLRGPTVSLLAAERTALNFLQRLSGVATAARRYADAVKGTGVRVVDTRKTTPGMRALERHAVRCGGCFNHRSSLGEHVLIKDNHIAACASLEDAVRRCRERAPHTAKIEVEAKTPAQVRAACRSRADVILLDNMTPRQVRAAVSLIAGRALIEMSGGISLETIRDYAVPGVDVISVGSLTHSAPAADLSLEIRARR
jgi:nicotinate-nucleotide pyrophosphorylase (carboxylating)